MHRLLLRPNQTPSKSILLRPMAFADRHDSIERLPFVAGIVFSILEKIVQTAAFKLVLGHKKRLAVEFAFCDKPFLSNQFCPFAPTIEEARTYMV